MSDVIFEMAEKMEKSVEAFKTELSKVRTGRASLSLLDGILVDAYGSSMPMNQVGTLTIPESRMIAIQPWDPQMLPAIEKAILKSDIGLTPVSDGKIVRLNIPQLTGRIGPCNIFGFCSNETAGHFPGYFFGNTTHKDPAQAGSPGGSHD